MALATDGSVMIAAGGDAQQLFGGVVPPTGYLVQNTSSGDLYISDVGIAGDGGSSFLILPRQIPSPRSAMGAGRADDLEGGYRPDVLREEGVMGARLWSIITATALTLGLLTGPATAQGLPGGVSTCGPIAAGPIWNAHGCLSDSGIGFTPLNRAYNGSDFATTRVAFANLHRAPQIANTAALRLMPTMIAKTSTPTFSNGVWRATDGVAGAGPLFFTASFAPCLVDDGASCINSADGKSWIAHFPVFGADLRQWGASANNSTDIGQFIQKAYNANLSPCILIPAGTWLWSSPVTMTAQPPCFKGAGWSEAIGSGAPGSGTWIHISSTSLTPITITAITGQGGTGGFADMAFYEDQPAIGFGWAPNAYQYIFTLNGNAGRVDFNNIMFYNTTHCISSIFSTRGHYNIYGQPLGTCLSFDNELDTVYLDQARFWPYWSSSPYVVSYTEAKVDPIVYARADSPFIHQVFALGYHSSLAFTGSSYGKTTGATIDDLQGDATLYTLWIESAGSGTQLQLNNLRTAGQGFPSGNLAGSEGVRIEPASANVQIGNLDCFWAGSDCVHVLSAGTVFIDNAILSHFNEDNNGSTGLNAGTSGYIAVATPPAVGSPANGGTLIPPSPSGGTYAMPVSQNWTPSVIGTTTTGTVTFSANGDRGTFWYSGGMVTANFYLNISSQIGFAGDIFLSNLPIAQLALTNQHGYCTISEVAGITLDSGYTMIAGVVAGNNTKNIQLVENGSGKNNKLLGAANFASGFVIAGSCSYRANQ